MTLAGSLCGKTLPKPPKCWHGFITWRDPCFTHNEGEGTAEIAAALWRLDKPSEVENVVWAPGRRQTAPFIHEFVKDSEEETEKHGHSSALTLCNGGRTHRNPNMGIHFPLCPIFSKLISGLSFFTRIKGTISMQPPWITWITSATPAWGTRT